MEDRKEGKVLWRPNLIYDLVEVTWRIVNVYTTKLKFIPNGFKLSFEDQQFHKIVYITVTLEP